MDEISKMIFSIQPTLSLEDLQALLRSVPLDPEEPDPEENYYNNNKFKIRTNIKKGIFDPEILRYSDVVHQLISNDCDLETYEMYVQEYCEAKGIDYETYKAERQARIEELAKTSTIPVTPYSATNLEFDDDDEIEYEDEFVDYESIWKRNFDLLSQTLDFINFQPLSEEEISAALKLEPETGPLPDPTNISREIFARALDSGEIDPALLTPEVFKTLFRTRLLDYSDFEKIYCMQKGLDYDTYKAQRFEIQQQLKKSHQPDLSEPVLSAKVQSEIPQVTAEPREEAQAPHIEPIPSNPPAPEPEPEGDSPVFAEQKAFLETSAKVAEENLPIKQTWLNKMKTWVKDVAKSVKDFFER